MSHYSVLVIGPEVDAQLAPFDENLAVEPYKSHLDDRSVEALKQWLLRERNIELPTDAQVVEHLGEWCGGLEDGEHRPGKDGQGFFVWSTYNPNHRWDWYELGGRWRGTFLLKPGASGVLGDPGVPESMALQRGDLSPEAERQTYRGRADQARKGDLDFAAMGRKGQRDGRAQYDLLLKVTAGLEPPRHTFANLLRRRAARRGLSESQLTEAFVDSVRKAFHRHPWVKAIQQHDEREYERSAKDRSYEPRLLLGLTGCDPVERYMVHCGGRKAYAARCGANEAYPFAAILEDGVWASDMPYYGPFAAMLGSEDEALALKIKARLAQLPDDTLLTVVDCHT